MKEVNDMVSFLWRHEFSVLDYFSKLNIEFPKQKEDMKDFVKNNFNVCKSLKSIIEKLEKEGK